MVFLNSCIFCVFQDFVMPSQWWRMKLCSHLLSLVYLVLALVSFFICLEQIKSYLSYPKGTTVQVLKGNCMKRFFHGIPTPKCWTCTGTSIVACSVKFKKILWLLWELNYISGVMYMSTLRENIHSFAVCTRLVLLTTTWTSSESKQYTWWSPSWKLDAVSPVDNRPSTNWLYQV